ncbi:MAG: hypothetical protein FWD67_00385 [Betaproteobacteria bacterium]|nr:hypothetical protein [Betaproteobacteria bacterium]
MNMPMQAPLPLQLSQPHGFAVPPAFRRALLYFVAVLVVALMLWFLSDAWHAEAEAEQNDARVSTQKTVVQLTSARETESARMTHVKRFALIKTALEKTSPGKTEWEQLTRQLSIHPHIVEPTLDSLPIQAAFPEPQNAAASALRATHPGRKMPAITIQGVRIEAGLLHEETLLVLDSIATGSPAHVIPIGCSLQREADTAPVTLRALCEFTWVALVPSLE